MLRWGKVQVEDLEIRKADLEDVFIELMGGQSETTREAA